MAHSRSWSRFVIGGLFAFLVVLLAGPAPALAQVQVSRDQRYSMFKRSLGPNWVRGVNGAMTAPSAGTLPRGQAALTWFATREGKLIAPGATQSNDVFRSTFSAFYGWQRDVEFGFTRKTLFESDLGQNRLNMEAQTWSLKASGTRLQDTLASVLFPFAHELESLGWPGEGEAPFELAIGLDYTALTDNGWERTDHFTDYYAVGTRRFAGLGRDWTASAGWRAGWRGELRSQLHGFAALGLALPWNTRADLEYVGASERLIETNTVLLDDAPILNLSLSWDRPLAAEGGWLHGGSLQVGADFYNLTKSTRGEGFDPTGERIEWGVHFALTFPLGRAAAPASQPTGDR